MDKNSKIPEGYHLVWEDNFEGDTLNMDNWSFECHEPGWVNNELQEYVESAEYAYVKDGHLVIQPLKNYYKSAKPSK
ncbi:MAG: hypothetical protein K2M91_08530 [Lachnospiraceae bacterium]|nr:hypothetical protein [Lachnospiraceae bacterium]